MGSDGLKRHPRVPKTTNGTEPSGGRPDQQNGLVFKRNRLDSRRQSIAFFNVPGIPPLYSWVEITKPSAA